MRTERKRGSAGDPPQLALAARSAWGTGRRGLPPGHHADGRGARAPCATWQDCAVFTVIYVAASHAATTLSQ